MMSIKEHPPQRRSEKNALHVPVLLETMLELMQPGPNESYLDLTAGYGGHARAFIERTANYQESVLVDRDSFSHEHLADLKKRGVRLVHSDFLSAAMALKTEGKQFDLVVADFGVSSPQLDKAERGFSFSQSGPLDMRMDQSQALTAEEIVNTYSESELEELIRRNGEEPRPVARRVARAIVEARPLDTTGELAEVIQATYRGRRGKIHPATRTFQALRIAVNDELGQIAKMLELLPNLVKPGGRVGILSFHSLEDRLVKQFFKEQEASGYEAEFSVVTKKAITGAQDDVHNPRARSAKLRVAVKK